ncbi:MAG: DUF3365 domain-containing protein [Magnetococcales bacterium]|nr:DUF3365 domain-containing protein [Magnetococcales bacterium]
MRHPAPRLNQILLARKFWVWPVMVWSLVAGLSILWNAVSLNQQGLALARERGWFTFQILEIARTWNARHGGVYVPITSTTQPNPYLNTSERDPVTVTGKRLTMVNPAFMTRQMAEIALERGGMILHITSLNPIRPANHPLAWESEALKGFERGSPEYLELVREEGQDIYRFMAPLRVREECLACHASQGYKVGDVRGGISIVFPARTILEGIQEQVKNVILLHLGVWGLLTGLTLWFLAWVRRHLTQIERLRLRYDSLWSSPPGRLHDAAMDGPHQAGGAHSLPLEPSGGTTGDVVEKSTGGMPLRQVPDDQHPRLLLVEDDPLNRRMLEALLQGMAMRPDVVRNGQEALDRLAAGDYDLVLMDCQMPVMDGFTASRELRRREAASGRRRTPVIAVTSFSLTGDQEECQKAGMDDYLAKPVCRQDLLNLLKRWLPQRSGSPSMNAVVAGQRGGDATDGPPTIDQRTFAMLCNELGDEVVAEVVKLFLETLPERMAAIEKGVAAGDAQMVHWATHPLKSPSRQLGAQRFGNLATELDTLTRNNSLQGARQLADQLAQEARRVKAALEEVVTRCQQG